MAKFKNIGKIDQFTPPVVPSAAPTLPATPVKKASSTTTVKVKRPVEKRSDHRSERAVPSKRETRKVIVNHKRLGKSVIILSLVVIVQIILLVSLIYLTPTLTK